MTSFSVMDWNAKTPLRWDWENSIATTAKAAEITKSGDWGIEVDGGIDDRPIYPSRGGHGDGGDGGSGSGYAGSDVGHVYSSNGSKSASVDSSSIEKTSEFCFGEFEGFHDYLIKNKELGRDNQTGNSQIFDASVGSAEPLIGLKLGKRTYFEDLSPLSNGKTSSASMHPVSSAPATKRHRPSYQNTSPSCQVEGCNLDLSSAKEYHRKHRICDDHSKFAKVVIRGWECRFCQQCSRFHDLQAFDEKKRSCRKRLSDHNARRRKPQHEAIQFNSPKQGSLFYDDRQHMGPNGFSFGHASPAGNFALESSFNPKFTLTKEGSLMPENTRDHAGQMHLLHRNQQNAVNMLYHDSNWLLPSKGGTGMAEIPSEDLEESMISSNSDAAQGYCCALSLLSNNSWGSTEPNAAFITHPVATTNRLINPATIINPVAVTSTKRSYQGLPFVASDSWMTTEQSSDIQMHSLSGQNNGNGHFPRY